MNAPARLKNASISPGLQLSLIRRIKRLSEVVVRKVRATDPAIVRAVLASSKILRLQNDHSRHSNPTKHLQP
jgi:hypothetical protein